MKRNVIIGSIVAGAALVAALPALATHSWSDYHWARAASPFTLQLGDNVSTSWEGHLGTASSDWSVSIVLDTAVVAGGTSATRGKNTPKNCVPTAGRVEVCNAKYGANGWLGIAQIWLNADHHITQGTAKMNDTYFNTGTYNSPAWKRLVMCQEVAHTFGLDHQDEVFDNANLGTCMDYTNDPDGGTGGASAGDPSNEHPNQHDYDQLVAIYTHADSTTTLGALAAKALGIANSLSAREGAGESEWGRAIRTDGQGRANVFEEDLGQGQKLITHVFWAE
jgi:hypothetical protein